MKTRQKKAMKTKGASAVPVSVARGMLKEVDVMVKPGVPLGARFEYRNNSLIIQSFTPQSLLPGEGVEVGMSLSHVDNESVIGYEQPQVLELLTRRAHQMKLVKFTGLPRNFEMNDSSPDRGRMEAKYGLDALAAARAERGNGGSVRNQDAEDDDWRKALEVKPASQSSFSLSKAKPKFPPPNQGGFSCDLVSIASTKAPHKQSSKSSIPGSDPFSTPARRRRIIADVSKFLLKQHCQKACKNVALWRKQTAASFIIQRAWRAKYARLFVARLRHRKWSAAALKIQRMVRAFLARAELQRRNKVLWLKRATHLATLLQKLWKERKMRMQAAKLRADRQARLMRRKIKMAMEIQRVFRGMWGRRFANSLRLQRGKFAQLRHRCAIKIQSVVRGHAARRLRASRQKARAKIGVSTLMYHRRLSLCRRVSCRVIQRVTRGYLGRNISCRLRHERELARMQLLAEEERRRLEALFQQLVREARQAEEDAAMKRADIRVTLNMRLLQHMAALGPAEVVRWALENSIILFDVEGGFDLGSVLKQVFASVLAAYPDIEARPSSRERPRSIEEDSNPAQDEEKCVKVRSWDVSEPTAPPPKECYPNGWGHVSLWKAGNGRDNEEKSISGAVGATVKVEREDSSLRVVLTKVLQPAKKSTVSVSMTSPVTQLNTAEVVFTLKTEITIVLESEMDEATGLPAIITPAAGVIINPTGFRTAAAATSRTERDNDFKFKFRDAIVTIEPPQQLSPVKEAHPIHIPDEENDEGNVEDKGEAAFEDSFDDSVDEEMQPTVVKIQFVEPDLNPQAAIIQRTYRAHFDQRKAAARRITGWLKTMRILEAWWDLVEEILELAIENAVVMQKYVRRMLADRKVARRRMLAIRRLSSLCMRNSAFLLDDMSSYRGFLASEANNWRTFGLEPDPSVPFVSLEVANDATSAEHKQVRTIDNCGVLVAGVADKSKNKRGDVGTTIARFVCSRLLTPDNLPGSVHPMQRLAASAYVPTPQPWDVFKESDLAISMSKESANGTSGEDESGANQRAVPTLHAALAETRMF